ncbi:hypothetical protein PEC301899_13600 [Pectobacterium carotovorum subsp. carotovorum]|nr:hypothetical protein PEC301899_13600 [Pectobacterium carotovorum subsp. carotovorum]
MNGISAFFVFSGFASLILFFQLMSNTELAPFDRRFEGEC